MLIIFLFLFFYVKKINVDESDSLLSSCEWFLGSVSSSFSIHPPHLWPISHIISFAHRCKVRPSTLIQVQANLNFPAHIQTMVTTRTAVEIVAPTSSPKSECVLPFSWLETQTGIDGHTFQTQGLSFIIFPKPIVKQLSGLGSPPVEVSHQASAQNFLIRNFRCSSGLMLLLSPGSTMIFPALAVHLFLLVASA